MKKNIHIEKMSVKGVQNLIDRAYREGSEMQFVRELYKNSIEAGATQIEFGPEWQGVEKQGVYRFMVADNGKGMNASEMETFLNTFGSGGKPVGGAHENYGIGAKTSTLPWNYKGVVVLSWTENDPVGSMLWLCKNPSTGEYGAKIIQTDDGEYNTVVSPYNDKEFGINWGKIKPSWLQISGTIVICLGNTGKENTFIEKGRGESFSLQGISAYLNKRIWEIPENVEIFVQELRSKKKEKMPKSIEEASRSSLFNKGKKDNRWNRRRVKGAKQHLIFPGHKKGEMGATGKITAKDGTELKWYLWKGERPNIHSNAHEKGYIAALYDNELYDVKTHHSSFS
ncbi:ATP-binding protein [Antarcticibacterium sp. 1MA-6-2]|uniref:ATP-binding protein n=1 Tax=Antarcticibacterium sp. 1MA-6-2 TaxID=2908210 RepID=UPI001F2218C5|nr:ATP-binding protein [Antarcticibacterium sp. 1MA-6-2]UJH91678.1 ATP-binding protein [Antarcticibacterium sp. 1MA-6-2]